MPVLYAFDEYKNKFAFNAEIAPAVPMQLPDGSILFYDRGASYGEYKINDSGYPERTDRNVDYDSETSNYWRYLICDSADLSEMREWGPDNVDLSLTDTAVGYGLPNTNDLLSRYSGSSLYIWQLVEYKRNTTGGKKWFVPSKDELNIVYQNKDAIVTAGGGLFLTNYRYWSSSEYSSDLAWYQTFSNGTQSGYLKNATSPCRLLRRI